MSSIVLHETIQDYFFLQNVCYIVKLKENKVLDVVQKLVGNSAIHSVDGQSC